MWRGRAGRAGPRRGHRPAAGPLPERGAGAADLALRGGGAAGRRGPGSATRDWFLAWQRWRRTHGLPARVFATVHAPAPDGTAGWTGGTKPQYVDFDSVLSLVALDGLLRDPGSRVAFAEVLPDEDELHVTSDRGRHVAELALEVP